MAFPVPGAAILLLNRCTGKQSRCSGKRAASEQERGKHHPRKRRPHTGQTTKGKNERMSHVFVVDEALRPLVRCTRDERGCCSKQARLLSSSATRLRSS